MTATETQFV